MNQKRIISFLFLFLLLGCKGEDFIMPYYDKILACLAEDHSYLEKVKEHRFELSDDASIFQGEDLLEPHIIFNKDTTDLCRDVKVEESWWNALPDVPSDENADEASKEGVVQLVFSFCFANHITGGKTFFDEDFSGDDALNLFTEYEKIGEKCGADAIPIPLSDQLEKFSAE